MESKLTSHDGDVHDSLSLGRSSPVDELDLCSVDGNDEEELIDLNVSSRNNCNEDSKGVDSSAEADSLEEKDPLALNSPEDESVPHAVDDLLIGTRDEVRDPLFLSLPSGHIPLQEDGKETDEHRLNIFSNNSLFVNISTLSDSKCIKIRKCVKLSDNAPSSQLVDGCQTDEIIDANVPPKSSSTEGSTALIEDGNIVKTNDKSNNHHSLNSSEIESNCINNTKNEVDQSPRNSSSAQCQGDLEEDDDVVFVERNEEIIELSDDESNEVTSLRSYLDTLNLPDQIVSDLRNASNEITLKLQNSMGVKNEIQHTFVEIPDLTWSIPWKAVSGLFAFPNLNKKRRKRSDQVLSKKKNSDGASKIKVKVPKKKSLSVDQTHNVCHIKQEKFLPDENVLSVVQLDPNKPPEFCEVSRSGRLIKKPNRLKDDMLNENSYRRRKSHRNTSSVTRPQNYYDDDSSSSNVSDQEPSPESVLPNKSPPLMTVEESVDNSITSETCDQWMLEADSFDSETDVEVDVEEVSGIPPLLPVAPSRPKRKSHTQPDLLKESVEGQLSKSSLHNMLEQARRRTMAELLKNLHNIVLTSFEGVATYNKASKISIISSAINGINSLRETLTQLENESKLLNSHNAKLKAKLLTMRIKYRL